MTPPTCVPVMRGQAVLSYGIRRKDVGMKNMPLPVRAAGSVRPCVKSRKVAGCKGGTSQHCSPTHDVFIPYIKCARQKPYLPYECPADAFESYSKLSTISPALLKIGVSEKISLPCWRPASFCVSCIPLRDVSCTDAD